MAVASETKAAEQTIEKGINVWFEEFKTPLQIFPYTGWYEWGKHTEDRWESYHGNSWPQWYRLQNLDSYDYSKNLLLCWLRSGNRVLLTDAERCIRFHLDNKSVNWSGGRDNKLSDPTSASGLNESLFYGKTIFLQPWYKSFRRMRSFLDYYDFTGDKRAIPVLVKLAITCLKEEHCLKEITLPISYYNYTAAFTARLYEWCWGR